MHFQSRQTSKLFWFSFVAIVPLMIFGAFEAGWYMRGTTDFGRTSQALRLNSGYRLIDPLLICNINNASPILEDKSLEDKIQKIVDSHKNAGDISKASVYLTDFSSGEWVSVYGNATFFPSSLGKIPIMITYYLHSENDPSILTKKITFPSGSPDLNDMQDLPPAQTIKQGYAYTIDQLIGYMIRYSDNNATALLDAKIDRNMLNEVYGDLNIPTNDSPNLSNLDFISAHQVSTLFRVLYNATYLSRDDSEKALQLLSQSSFTEGIAAGVSSSTPVSHKLGLVGIASGAVTTEHELHDCGIVYAKNSYVLCVMTRGSTSLTTLESIIAEISSAAYTDIQKNH